MGVFFSSLAPKPVVVCTAVVESAAIRKASEDAKAARAAGGNKGKDPGTQVSNLLIVTTTGVNGEKISLAGLQFNLTHREVSNIYVHSKIKTKNL